jgi:hypothetical protein
VRNLLLAWICLVSVTIAGCGDSTVPTQQQPESRLSLELTLSTAVLNAGDTLVAIATLSNHTSEVALSPTLSIVGINDDGNTVFFEDPNDGYLASLPDLAPTVSYSDTVWFVGTLFDRDGNCSVAPAGQYWVACNVAYYDAPRNMRGARVHLDEAVPFEWTTVTR